ncbi:MAG: hypothetical protein ACI8W8_004976, partial [Rhodothermales bacterium]
DTHLSLLRPLAAGLGRSRADSTPGSRLIFWKAETIGSRGHTPFNEHKRLQKSPASQRRTVIDNPNSRAAGNLAGAGIDFTGCVAVLNFGDHVTGARIVRDHSAGSNTFGYSPNIIPFKNTKGYFFEGGVGNTARPMLDMAEEWAYNERTKTLYLWPDDGQNPNGREVRSKSRIYSLTGDADTHDIVIDGLNFFATAFSFKSSDRITIRNCDFDYPAASKRALGGLRGARQLSVSGLPSRPLRECHGIQLCIPECRWRRVEWRARAECLGRELSVLSHRLCPHRLGRRCKSPGLARLGLQTQHARYGRRCHGHTLFPYLRRYHRALDH